MAYYDEPTIESRSLVVTIPALVAVVWFVVVWCISALGNIQVRRKIIPPLTSYNGRSNAICRTLAQPYGVTILRPIKTVSETTCQRHLIECLLSTVRQTYPLFELIFLVAGDDDPALFEIRALRREYSNVDIKLIVGAEDIGINPKINNLVRGWREAKHDIIWILDCNVWVDAGALGRAVDVLTGQPYADETGRIMRRRPAKFAHHLPLCVDTMEGNQSADTWTKFFGSRLEEMFLSSAHCKFYTAINIVAVAPCIVGKSNFFRKSNLMEICPPTPTSEGGLSAFSHGMCEDHLIGEKLWYTKLAEEDDDKPYLKHVILNEMVFQPVCRMSLGEYWHRRTRWLRVRKYTVLAATLVEPGTESFVCTLIGAWGFTTLELLPAWLNMWRFWLLSVSMWAATDYSLFNVLHQYQSVNVDNATPDWITRVKVEGQRHNKRSIRGFLAQWIGREVLAFPIWVTAMVGGDVNWRGTSFKVTINGPRSS